jgi:hypothetical protein
MNVYLKFEITISLAILFCFCFGCNFGSECDSDSVKECNTSDEQNTNSTCDELAEVIQPDADLSWLRCPINYCWQNNGCNWVSNPGLDWETSSSLCPEGYRIPTIDEFMGLLENCQQSDAGIETYFFCDACRESSTCASMFGSTDNFNYWTSSVNEDFEFEVWTISFDTGLFQLVPMNENHAIRCVRDI